MKIFLIALSAIFMANFALSIDLDEIDNAKMRCKKETVISQDSLFELQSGGYFDEPKVKEYLKCYFSKLQVLEDKNINIEKLKQYLEVKVPDKTEDEREKIVEKCNKKQESAEETALKLAKCIVEKKARMYENIMKAWSDCAKEADLWDRIDKNGDIIDDPKVKKTLKCYYSSLHVMTDGVINSEMLKLYMEITLHYKTSDELKKIVQECNKNKESADETAFELSKCHMKHL